MSLAVDQPGPPTPDSERQDGGEQRQHGDLTRRHEGVEYEDHHRDSGRILGDCRQAEQ